MMHLLTVDIVPCAVLLGIALLTLRWCAPASAQRAADLLNHRYWLFISVLMLIVYGAALGCSLYLPIGIDVIEVSVSDISSLFLRGLPIYTSLGAANRYSLLYGPLCYLPFSLALGLFGPSLASLKLAVFLLNVGLFLMLWVAFRRAEFHSSGIDDEGDGNLYDSRGYLSRIDNCIGVVFDFAAPASLGYRTACSCDCRCD
jgi:hypothetical protein